MPRLQDDGVTIHGHPGIPVVFSDGSTGEFTVCAGCGHLRTILWLSQDRWYCTQCRSNGNNKPKQYFLPVGLAA